MVIRKEARRANLIEHMRGGKGSINKFDYELPQELPHTKMLAEIWLQPGCSIGAHVHQGEHEVFFCHKGEIVLNDNTEERILYPGDISICFSGELHGIENRSQTKACVYAIIISE